MAEQFNFSSDLTAPPSAQSATQVAGGLAAVDATNTSTALDTQRLNANLPAASVAATNATTTGVNLDNETKQLALNNRMAMNKGMQTALQNWQNNNKTVSDPNNAPALPAGVDASYTKDTVHNTWKDSSGTPIDMTSPDAPLSLPDGSPNTLNPSWISKMYDAAIAAAPSTGGSVADIQSAKLQALESAQNYHAKYVETYKAQQDALKAQADADNKKQETAKLAANNMLDGTFDLTHNNDGSPKSVPQLEAAWGGAGANPLQKSMAKQFSLDLTKPLSGQMVNTPAGPVPAPQFLANLAQGSPKGLEIAGKISTIASQTQERALAPVKLAVEQGNMSADIGAKVEKTFTDGKASLAVRDQAMELRQQLGLLQWMRDHNQGPSKTSVFLNSLPDNMKGAFTRFVVNNNIRDDSTIDYGTVAKAVQAGVGGFDITLQSAGGAKISSGSDSRMKGIVEGTGQNDWASNPATFDRQVAITNQYLDRADSFAHENIGFANSQLQVYRTASEKANPGSGKYIPSLPEQSQFQKAGAGGNNPLIPKPPVVDKNGVPAKVDTTAPVRMKDANGKFYNIPSGKVAAAKADGLVQVQ